MEIKTMSNDNFVTNVEQKSSFGSETTQIATQNNYYGMTPNEACNMTMKLFQDNFPVLEQKAVAAAKKKAEELMKKVIEKLEKDNVRDYSPFGEPDVQYVFLEAQKSYARFGTEDKLSLISKLLSHRITNNNEDSTYKVLLDKAIEITPLLTEEQTDYISLLFLTTKVKFDSIKELTQLDAHFKYISNVFCKSNPDAIAYLNTLGCLQMALINICNHYSDAYGFLKEDVEKICPNNIKKFDGDYTTSPIGSLIAMVNIEQKTHFRFNNKEEFTK